jgi:hypothetical protein
VYLGKCVRCYTVEITQRWLSKKNNGKYFRIYPSFCLYNISYFLFLSTYSEFMRWEYNGEIIAIFTFTLERNIGLPVSLVLKRVPINNSGFIIPSSCGANWRRIIKRCSRVVRPSVLRSQKYCSLGTVK